LGIESTCEVGIPIIIDNFTNTPIIPRDNKFIPKTHSDYIDNLLKSDPINRYPSYIPREKERNKELYEKINENL